MNQKQRQILTDWYDYMLRCTAGADPAGFCTDSRYYMSDIAKTDNKLREMFEEIYKEWEQK